MPELRKDPVVGRWVIIATERGKRPSDYRLIEPVPAADHRFCPFCPGNEAVTPAEVLAYRADGSRPNGPGWHLRVIPNKFPALRVEGSLSREGEGIYDKMSGVGAHEVIIETADHKQTLSNMPIRQLHEVLWSYRDRIVDLRRDQRLRYILIFKNQGASAGASVDHSHSQLIALPIVPKNVAEEIRGAEDYYRYKERCIYCDIIRQELAAGQRVVAQNEHFITLVPYAPRFPFETWILPKAHRPAFEESDKAEFESLALLLQDTLRRQDRALDVPPYNFLLHSSPTRHPNNDDQRAAYYHWHLEIMPRMTSTAGFERGTGFYINPTPPEDAAQFLRDAEP